MDKVYKYVNMSTCQADQLNLHSGIWRQINRLLLFMSQGY